MESDVLAEGVQFLVQLAPELEPIHVVLVLVIGKGRRVELHRDQLVQLARPLGETPSPQVRDEVFAGLSQVVVLRLLDRLVELLLVDLNSAEPSQVQDLLGALPLGVGLEEDGDVVPPFLELLDRAILWHLGHFIITSVDQALGRVGSVAADVPDICLQHRLYSVAHPVELPLRLLDNLLDVHLVGLEALLRLPLGLLHDGPDALVAVVEFGQRVRHSQVEVRDLPLELVHLVLERDQLVVLHLDDVALLLVGRADLADVLLCLLPRLDDLVSNVLEAGRRLRVRCLQLRADRDAKVLHRGVPVSRLLVLQLVEALLDEHHNCCGL